MTRDEYLSEGLEPITVPYDSTGSYERRYQSAQKLRQSVAKKIAPEIAPDLTLNDMPFHIGDEQRKSAFETLPFNASSRTEISRKAVELELCNDIDYWTGLKESYETCGLAKDALLRNGGRTGGRAAAKKLEQVQGVIKHGYAEVPRRDGCVKTGGAFADVAFDMTNGLSGEDRTLLAAHAVMHARQYARAERQFDALTSHLPESATPWLESIKEAWDCGTVMRAAREQDDEAFDIKLRGTQMIAVDAAKKEMKGTGNTRGSFEDRSINRDKVNAIYQKIRASCDMDCDSPEAHKLNAGVNKAIFDLRPTDGSLKDLVKVEIARRSREERSATVKNLFTARSSGAER
jgi:hypothetical protein